MAENTLFSVSLWRAKLTLGSPWEDWKPRIACWVLGHDPGPGGLLVGVELSARHQAPCHGLATVNVIEITAFAKGWRFEAGNDASGQRIGSYPADKANLAVTKLRSFVTGLSTWRGPRKPFSASACRDPP